jgi:hypothetical protein
VAERLTSSKAATLNFGLLLVTVVLPTKSSHGHSLLRVGEKVGTIKHGAPSIRPPAISQKLNPTCTSHFAHACTFREKFAAG